MSRQVFTSLTSNQVAALADDVEYEAWERKVLNTFLEGEEIQAIPAGYKKRLAVLKWLVNHLEEGVRYSEKEINEIIERHHPDYCTLRRALIDNGLMEREGGVYRRVEWQMPELGE
jgi:hypothetical protein